MNDYVCSNCGSPCGSDARMGSLDVYLMCECSKSYTWVNDGRGGYPVYVNDAQPVRVHEYHQQKVKKVVTNSSSLRNWDDWGRDDD